MNASLSTKWNFFFSLPIPFSLRISRELSKQQSSPSVGRNGTDSQLKTSWFYFLCVFRKLHLAITWLDFIISSIFHPSISLSWFTVRWTIANTSMCQWSWAQPYDLLSLKHEWKWNCQFPAVSITCFCLPLWNYDTLSERKKPQVTTDLRTKDLWSRLELRPQHGTEPH